MIFAYLRTSVAKSTVNTLLNMLFVYGNTGLCKEVTVASCKLFVLQFEITNFITREFHTINHAGRRKEIYKMGVIGRFDDAFNKYVHLYLCKIVHLYRYHLLIHPSFAFTSHSRFTLTLSPNFSLCYSYLNFKKLNHHKYDIPINSIYTSHNSRKH